MLDSIFRVIHNKRLPAEKTKPLKFSRKSEVILSTRRIKILGSSSHARNKSCYSRAAGKNKKRKQAYNRDKRRAVERRNAGKLNERPPPSLTFEWTNLRCRAPRRGNDSPGIVITLPDTHENARRTPPIKVQQCKLIICIYSTTARGMIYHVIFQRIFSQKNSYSITGIKKNQSFLLTVENLSGSWYEKTQPYPWKFRRCIHHRPARAARASGTLNSTTPLLKKKGTRRDVCVITISIAYPSGRRRGDPSFEFFFF